MRVSSRRAKARRCARGSRRWHDVPPGQGPSLMACHREVNDRELGRAEWGRGASHRLGRALGLRKGDHLADTVAPREEHGQTIDSYRDTAMRRRPEFEGLEQVAEFLVRFRVGHSDNAEDAFLQLAAVDADTATPELVAIADDVVLLGTNTSWIGLEVGQILVDERRELVVLGLP